MNQFIQNHKDEFNKVIVFFKKDISSLRTGRANLSILDNVIVEAYGVKNSIQHLANLSIQEARNIIITPWDKNIIKDIEKAITQANLGVSIVNEGDKIRIVVPSLTEELRKEMVKKLDKKMEQAKINIRQIRNDIKNEIIKAYENKEINEDEKFSFIEELNNEVHNFQSEIEDIKLKKQKEIMEI